MAANSRRIWGDRIFSTVALFAGASIVLVVVAIPMLARMRESDGHEPPCSNKMKQIALVMRMYANDDPEGRYPPLALEPGTLMFPDTLHPYYAPDGYIFICRSDRDDDIEQIIEHLEEAGHDPYSSYAQKTLIDDYSYFYLGYAVTNDADVALFAKAYRELGPSDPRLLRDINARDFTEDVSSATEVASDPLEDNPNTLYRLREDVGDDLIHRLGLPSDESGASTRAQAMIPVLIERRGNHVPNGINVVYMDGHVESRRPGEWPNTERTMRLLRELDALRDG